MDMDELDAFDKLDAITSNISDLKWDASQKDLEDRVDGVEKKDVVEASEGEVQEESEEEVDDSIEEEVVDDEVEDTDEPDAPSNLFEHKFNGETYNLTSREGQEAFKQAQQTYFTQTRQSDREALRLEQEQLREQREELARKAKEAEELQRDLQDILSKPENEELRKQYKDVTQSDIMDRRLKALESKLEESHKKNAELESRKLFDSTFEKIEASLKIPATIDQSQKSMFRREAAYQAEQRGIQTAGELQIIYEQVSNDYVEAHRRVRSSKIKSARKKTPAISKKNSSGKVVARKPSDKYAGKGALDGISDYVSSVMKELGV